VLPLHYLTRTARPSTLFYWPWCCLKECVAVYLQLPRVRGREGVAIDESCLNLPPTRASGPNPEPEADGPGAYVSLLNQAVPRR